MQYLLVQIFLCLLVAFLIGLLIGWWIARNRCRSRIAALEAERDALQQDLNECRAARKTGGAAAAAAPLAAMGAVAGGRPASPDDLKLIWGIGPKMEELLNNAGLWTFEAVASTSVERLRAIVEEFGTKKLTDIANEEVWPEQAAMAARGDWDALKEYQQQLSWREGGGKPTD